MSLNKQEPQVKWRDYLQAAAIWQQETGRDLELCAIKHMFVCVMTNRPHGNAVEIMDIALSRIDTSAKGEREPTDEELELWSSAQRHKKDFLSSVCKKLNIKTTRIKYLFKIRAKLQPSMINLLNAEAEKAMDYADETLLNKIDSLLIERAKLKNEVQQ